MKNCQINYNSNLRNNNEKMDLDDDNKDLNKSSFYGNFQFDKNKINIKDKNKWEKREPV